jgi:hypothetical protein
LLCVVHGDSYAQRLKRKRHDVLQEQCLKINVAAPIFSNTLSVAYEKMLDKEISWQIQSGITYHYDLDAGVQHTRMFTLSPEYRYVINEGAKYDLFVSGFARYILLDIQADLLRFYGDNYYLKSGSYQSHSAGLGFLLGAQKTFKQRVKIEVFAGPCYMFNLYDELKAKANPNAVPNPYYSDPILTRRSMIVDISPLISTRFIDGYGIRAGMMVGFMF